MLHIIKKIKVPVNVQDYSRLYLKILNQLGMTEKEINLVFTNDEEIEILNSQYRKKNAPTDVLSFSYFDPSFPNQGKNLYGEIVISVDSAKKNANIHKNSLKKELYKLFVHGVLHLFGFDHEKNKDYLSMKKIEDSIEEWFYERENM